MATKSNSGDVEASAPQNPVLIPTKPEPHAREHHKSISLRIRIPHTALLLYEQTMPRRSGLLLLLLLLSVFLLVVAAGAVPPTCERIECPAYDVVDNGNGFEIRRYDGAVWMSTAPIEDISLVAATRTGFLQLFDYIQGKNAYNETIKMTAPVITQVAPSDGPFCASSFVVSFYVPKKNQPDPPPAKGLHLQKWGVKYAAVRQFGGFVADSDVGEQAALLDASLQGTKWAAAVSEGRKADPTSRYTVAQYNSPFEFSGRVNEILMVFDAIEGLSM